MRASGEAVSLRIGDRTILIGEAFELQTTRGEGRRCFARLWFKPYWPGYLHAVALLADRRKENRKPAK